MGRISEAAIGDEPYFDGNTYIAPRDQARLSSQLHMVVQILSDNQWHTLDEMAKRIGGSQAGISARIRDLRKARFGARKIERRYINNGLWEYRLS